MQSQRIPAEDPLAFPPPSSSNSETGLKRVRFHGTKSEQILKRLSFDSKQNRMSLEISNPLLERERKDVNDLDENKQAQDERTSSDEFHKPKPKRSLSTKSLPRRFLPRIGSKEKLRTFNPEVSEYVLSLEQILKDKTSRNVLIKGLVQEKSDLCVKIRFCAAVHEFEVTRDKTEKKSKGRKIVSLFIQNGSMFQLNGTPYQ